MLTRVEIDGFKTFENFVLDLRPFSAIVGPNASGKSNLFDAIKFLSLLAQHDIRTAMQGLRGQPEELFRQTDAGPSTRMRFALEVLLNPKGEDQFQTQYDIKAQRLRYEVQLSWKVDAKGQPRGIVVSHESCVPMAKKTDRTTLSSAANIRYSRRGSAFISTDPNEVGEPSAFEIHQDGPQRHGQPLRLPAGEASRTALSTITTAEFPHLYALRDLLASIRFLEINPQAARRPTDRFETRVLQADASNLASVLARLKDETATATRPNGVIADISASLASLIPSVQSVDVFNDDAVKEYAFGISTSGQLKFSSRVISDGTLRLLALLAVLEDPRRRGVLCFEEPENGVHEGRIPALVGFLREAVAMGDANDARPIFQILINTHSPAVMESLREDEIVVAETVSVMDRATGRQILKTRMTSSVTDNRLPLNPDTDITRAVVLNLLRRKSDAA